jgi:hypothetical protein
MVSSLGTISIEELSAYETKVYVYIRLSYALLIKEIVYSGKFHMEVVQIISEVTFV